MVFRFDCNKKSDAKAVVTFLERIASAAPKALAGMAPPGRISINDARLFRNLLSLPPHLLALEDMTFCQSVMQTLVENAMPGHKIQMSLTDHIDVDWQDGLRIYYVPSSKADRILRF